MTTRSPSPRASAPPLTYGALRALIDRAVRALNDLAVGRGDRVAIVLPNGPEMATAFLSVASAAASAPLNPAYRQDEFEFYLEDLKAKALIVEAGSESPALRAAEKLGVALITLTPEPQAGAGAFRLSGPARGGAVAARPRRSGRRGAYFAHLGHHLAAENRAAHSRQHLDLGPQHRGLARAFGQGPGAQRDAPVPHSWADRRPLRAALAWRGGVLHARVQRAEVLCRDGGSQAHLVHGGADHASDDPDARRAPQGDHRQASVALRALIIGLAAAERHRRTRGCIQMPGHRSLRDDGSDASDGVQPPQWRAQTWIGRRRRGS